MLQPRRAFAKPFQVKPTVTHLESSMLDPTALRGAHLIDQACQPRASACRILKR